MIFPSAKLDWLKHGDPKYWNGKIFDIPHIFQYWSSFFSDATRRIAKLIPQNPFLSLIIVYTSELCSQFFVVVWCTLLWKRFLTEVLNSVSIKMLILIKGYYLPSTNKHRKLFSLLFSHRRGCFKGIWRKTNCCSIYNSWSKNQSCGK